MQSSRMKQLRLTTAAIFILGGLGAGPSAAQDLSALYEAAKLEGEFTFYTSSSEATIAELVKAFNKDFPGITVNVLRLPSGALNTRYGNEVGAGVFEADLFNSATTDLWDLHADWWQPLTDEMLPTLAGWPAAAKTPTYLHASFSEHGLVYNTELVTAPPQTWQEVLDPVYQGKCLMIDPRTSPTFVSFYAMLAETYGDEYLSKLKDQSCKLSAAGLPTSQEVGAGGALIGFPVTVSQVNEPKAMGAPIERVRPAQNDAVPAHGIVQYYGVPAKSAHPNAAQLYLAWFLSGAAQQLECELGGYASPHPEVKGCDSVSEKFLPARSVLPEGSKEKVFSLLGLPG